MQVATLPGYLAICTDNYMEKGMGVKSEGDGSAEKSRLSFDLWVLAHRLAVETAGLRRLREACTDRLRSYCRGFSRQAAMPACVPAMSAKMVICGPGF